MKYINKIIRLFVRVPLFWKLVTPVIRFFKNVEFQHQVVLARASHDMIRKDVLKEPVVRNGLFKGLKYPSFEAAGSAIFPKFIGSYESELSGVFDAVIRNRYDIILDIGCAEGYYANGLAMRLPSARVYAYDIDARARRICRQIAELNGLQERVVIGAHMDAAGLASFDLKEAKVLVISDCEGYEKELFTPANMANLAHADLLIEVHDLFDLTISAYLRKLFSATHHIQVISSIDDIKKAQEYAFPETDGLELEVRKIIFAEGRKAAMEWFYCTPK